MAFADRLKDARLKKGYTQEQIAEKIGVAKSTYTGYEKGNREPNVYTIGKLMEELCVDANFLWQDDTTFPFELTYDEMENLVKKYRVLDPHGKEMVDFTLEKEWERSKQLREDHIYNFESNPLLVAESATNYDTKEDPDPSIIQPHTIAAHFDGDKLTTDELEEIAEFEKIVKNRKK